jgi:hypothetical protein
MAFTSSAARIIDDILHSQEASPTVLGYMNARDPAALKVLSNTLIPYFEGRDEALLGYLKDAEEDKIQVSEKTKAFWREKQSANKVLLDVMKDAEKSDAELDDGAKTSRAEYLKEAKVTWEVNLRDALIKLNGEIIGPFCLGTAQNFSLHHQHTKIIIRRRPTLIGRSPPRSVVGANRESLRRNSSGRWYHSYYQTRRTHRYRVCIAQGLCITTIGFGA